MYYINTKRDYEVETVDEFEDKKEAYEMCWEYQVSDGSTEYYVSQRCTKDWEESQ